VIPDPDPIALPAPVELLTPLLVLTFTLHILAMNVTLGGTIIAAVGDLLGRRNGNSHYRRLAQHLIAVMPITLAATITLGVAPLLFIQTLYGQLFYTSSILMAWPWFAVVPLVIVAYYGIYLYALQGERLGEARIWVGAGSAFLLIVVAFLYVNNLTLMLTPDRWRDIYADHSNGIFLNGAERTLVPRLFHFLLAAPAVAGAFIVGYAAFMRNKTEEAYWTWVARHGALWFIGPTLLQLAVGPVFLVVLPAEIRDQFIGDNVGRTHLLFAGVGVSIVGLLAMVAALRARNPLWPGLAGAVSVVATVSLMSVVRHVVRDEYLKPEFSTSALEVDSQTVLIVVFFVLLVAAIGVIGYMLRAVLQAPRRT
jgi:cytochrome bd-type quinol oxidase subunit 1